MTKQDKATSPLENIQEFVNELERGIFRHPVAECGLLLAFLASIVSVGTVTEQAGFESVEWA